MDDQDSHPLIEARMRLSRVLHRHVRPEYFELSDDALVRAVFRSYIEERARDDYRAPD